MITSIDSARGEKDVMARFNACSELAKFWVEVRHGYLVTESVPVKVPYGISDIDIIAMHPKAASIALPDGNVLGPRLIIESKDEHDFDPKGTAFAKMLRSDATLLGESGFVPKTVTAQVKFTMLREAHFVKATDIFKTDDFDRLFIVHAIDPSIIETVKPLLTGHRIHWLTIREVLRDLEQWYKLHPQPAGLRHSPIGDLLHLLFGYCGVTIPTS